jgi:hypothetical protein
MRTAAILAGGRASRDDTPACLEPIARRLAARRLKLLEFADVNTPADCAGLEALQGHKP